MRAVIAVLAVTWVLLTGCAINPATGQKQLYLFTTADEIQLGRQAAPDVEKQYGGKLENPALQAYVDSVGQKVARVSDRRDLQYHYAVLNSDIPNAFALPGGYIYITRGLLTNIQDEAQLAAVLGHETGHVAARDGVQQLQRSLGLSILVDAVGSTTKSSDAKAVAQVVAGLTSLRYSRQDEARADTLGAKYGYLSGYNPWGMVGLLQVLQTQEKTESSRWTEMFQTHPLTANRIADAQSHIQSTYPNARNNARLEYGKERFSAQTKGLH